MEVFIEKKSEVVIKWRYLLGKKSEIVIKWRYLLENVGDNYQESSQEEEANFSLKNEVIRLENEIVIFEIVFGMVSI